MIRRVRGDGDRGSIAPLVPIVLFAVFLLGGLVVDGSRDLNARSNAQSYAEEAARAGATAVDLTAADVVLDQPTATARVDAYCATIKQRLGSEYVSCGLDFTKGPFTTTDQTCTGTTQPIVVDTVVTLRIETTLLGMIGVSNFTVTGRAQARPYEGTDTGC